jgi:opacity protein-like surface antigen
MKNNVLISDLGPHLLTDYSSHRPVSSWGSWLMGVTLWAATLAVLCWISWGVAQAETTPSDPLVMKVYPDGTKVILRWSEVGQRVDHGEQYGGAPRIVAYDPAQDGIVPIGEPSKKTEVTSTNAALPGSSSVVSPEQPQKMDYTNANPDDLKSDFGSYEGFAFRTAVGVAFQQSLSGRSGSGSTYSSITFQPGIRYDIEANYNVTEWFRVGLETAFIYNEIHSVTDNGIKGIAGGSALGNGGYYQIPALVNAVFTYPSDGPARGYLGAATGATWDVLQYSANGGGPYTSYQWNYAWQVTAGFIYAVAPGLDLDIAYKMLSNPSPNFNGAGSFKSSYNHTAEIGLAWRF